MSNCVPKYVSKYDFCNMPILIGSAWGRWEIRIKDDQDVDIDLAGCTHELIVFTQAGDEYLVLEDADFQRLGALVTQNWLGLELSAAETEVMLQGDYLYEYYITYPDGSRRGYLKGQFPIIKQVP